jgi:hypothetical protein
MSIPVSEKLTANHYSESMRNIYGAKQQFRWSLIFSITGTDSDYRNRQRLSFKSASEPTASRAILIFVTGRNHLKL